jgi:hypothetical protein
VDKLNDGIGCGGAQGTMSEVDFQNRLGKLAEEWRSARTLDLELRYKTGLLLNERIGDPTCRQRRHAQVSKTAAEQLRVAESDLYRMRQFAFCFKSFQDLEQKYPAARTWTAVKELLPTSMPQGNKPEQSPDGADRPAKRRKTKSSKLGGLMQPLRTLFSKVRKVRGDLTGPELRRFLDKFLDFAGALEECLKIRVSVNTVQNEQTPPAAPTEINDVGNSASTPDGAEVAKVLPFAGHAA